MLQWIHNVLTGLPAALRLAAELGPHLGSWAHGIVGVAFRETERAARLNRQVGRVESLYNDMAENWVQAKTERDEARATARELTSLQLGGVRGADGARTIAPAPRFPAEPGKLLSDAAKIVESFPLRITRADGEPRPSDEEGG